MQKFVRIYVATMSCHTCTHTLTATYILIWARGIQVNSHHFSPLHFHASFLSCFKRLHTFRGAEVLLLLMLVCVWNLSYPRWLALVFASRIFANVPSLILSASFLCARGTYTFVCGLCMCVCVCVLQPHRQIGITFRNELHLNCSTLWCY